MSGAVLFLRFNFIIHILSTLVGFIPFFVLTFIWSLSKPFEGYISLLTRYLILKSRAKSCGDNVFIGSNVTIKNINNLIVGESVSIHSNSYLDCAGGVFIGNNVSIAHNSSIVSFEHSWEETSLAIKYNPTVLKSVTILDDVWVGCGVRILSGASISARVVVAAGSVVKGNVEGNSLYAGVPAKKIRELNGNV